MIDDPELQAMQSVVQALTDLDDESRGRVIDWVARRYGVTVRPAGGVAAVGTPHVATGAPAPAVAGELVDFADLLGAANPRTDVERALVGGYWFQVQKENPSFNAQDINTELKNAGQGVKNITDALAGLIERRPQLVLQVAKTGRTRQARKTYKLTTAGVTAVRQMIQRATSGENGQ